MELFLKFECLYSWKTCWSLSFDKPQSKFLWRPGYNLNTNRKHCGWHPGMEIEITLSAIIKGAFMPEKMNRTDCVGWLFLRSSVMYVSEGMRNCERCSVTVQASNHMLNVEMFHDDLNFGLQRKTPQLGEIEEAIQNTWKRHHQQWTENGNDPEGVANKLQKQSLQLSDQWRGFFSLNNEDDWMLERKRWGGWYMLEAIGRAKWPRKPTMKINKSGFCGHAKSNWR